MKQERCAEDLKNRTSSHDWPITNLKTGQVSGLCWFCGCPAQEFYDRVKDAEAKKIGYGRR